MAEPNHHNAAPAQLSRNRLTLAEKQAELVGRRQRPLSREEALELFSEEEVAAWFEAAARKSEPDPYARPFQHRGESTLVQIEPHLVAELPWRADAREVEAFVRGYVAGTEALLMHIEARLSGAALPRRVGGDQSERR